MKSNFKLKIRGLAFIQSGARGKPWLGVQDLRQEKKMKNIF